MLKAYLLMQHFSKTWFSNQIHSISSSISFVTRIQQCLIHQDFEVSADSDHCWPEGEHLPPEVQVHQAWGMLLTVTLLEACLSRSINHLFYVLCALFIIYVYSGCSCVCVLRERERLRLVNGNYFSPRPNNIYWVSYKDITIT